MLFRLPHLLEQSRARYPDHAAVVEGDRSTSYDALDSLSTNLALWLTRHGMRPGDRVGLFLPKSTESLIALFGIMKAGGVYVPIDASSPANRAAHIVRDCGIRLVVTSEPKCDLLRKATEAVGVEIAPIVVGGSHASASSSHDEARWEDAISETDPGSLPRGTECDLAYILYTSGSTGSPKGVMISHRAALSFVNWTCSEFALVHDDVVSSHAPLHFDLSVFDVFSTIKVGATIVLLREGASTFPIQLTGAIAELGITVWYSVPSALILMLERGKFAEMETGSLRTVLFAGEVFPTPHLKKLRSATSARLVNLFGPTETNVCTFYEVEELPEDDETIPIGRPTANYDVFPLRADGTLAGPDEEGELHARGPGLMSGYWGDHEKTASALVQNPLHDRYHDPVYRTGDLVKTDREGRFRFLGRRDHQVKIRGYRIELGEIEAAIYSLDGVAEAVAVVAQDGSGDERVAAVIVAAEGRSVTADAVKTHLVSLVPRYMIPEQLVIAPSLPHTSTGKIDRQEVLRQLATAGGDAH
jgi:L-proline---[L-prolyl-carrier protein] ligase